MSIKDNGIEVGMKLTAAIDAMGFNPEQFIVTNAATTRNRPGSDHYDIRAQGPAGMTASVSFTVEEFA